MALVSRCLLLLLILSFLVYIWFYSSSPSTNSLMIPSSSPKYTISRHFRFVKGSHLRFSTQSYLSHNKSLLLLLLLLCGDVEINPGPPGDIVNCVCSSTEESGLMLQCDQCSCWLHNECVNVPAHIGDNFPFICPLCIKSSLSLILSLKSEISHLKAHIVKLEKSCKSLSTQLSALQPITGSSISDTIVKCTATSSNSPQPVPSNSHPSNSHPVSPNPAHLNTSNVRSNASLPSKFLNKHSYFLSQA